MISNNLPSMFAEYFDFFKYKVYFFFVFNRIFNKNTYKK